MTLCCDTLLAFKVYPIGDASSVPLKSICSDIPSEWSVVPFSTDVLLKETGPNTRLLNILCSYIDLYDNKGGINISKPPEALVETFSID